MRKFVFALFAALLLCGAAIPAAGAAELTTEQKFEVLKQNGIFAGFSDGSAGLHQSMTREQFAQVLFKLLELPEPNNQASYLDVIKTRWSYKPVESVTEAGLMVGVGKKKFAPASPVTVEQLATVLVKSYGWNSGGIAVSGKVSAWARQYVGIALQQKLIPVMNDYTLTATRGLLVEAAYRVYIDTNDDIKVKTILAANNQTIHVMLSQAVSAVETSRLRLRDVTGVEVRIHHAVLSGDKLSIVLVTDRQVAGRVYALWVDGNIAGSYAAVSDDNVKPTVSSFLTQPDNVLEIIFSEEVNRESATRVSNYTLNHNLRINSVNLGSDNRKVTIVTSVQEKGKTYSLVIRNVKDLYGNVMDAYSKNFDVPFITSFKVDEATARITITFNEKINPQQAVHTGHYSIDKGVSVTRAELDPNGTTVYLTTTAQKDATVYTLTVSFIRDLAGNTMQNQSFHFAGNANPVQSLRLESASTVNENTLELQFNRPVSDNEVSKIGTAVLTDNGSSVSMNGWSAFRLRKSDRSMTVQFRTGSDTNPHLFKASHLYKIRVTGLHYLVTENNAHEVLIAGTSTDNPVPVVTQVVEINDNAVKVFFSEPVKNVSETAFILYEKGGARIRIADDTLNDTNRVVTEVVLNLTDKLEAGHDYVMTFRPGTVTDAAGWNGFKTSNGSEDYSVSFKGV